MFKPSEITIMRRVFSGDLTREQFAGLETNRERVMAAIAYIIVHREDYLTRHNFLRTPYERLLVEIIGRDSTKPYVHASVRAGLHLAHPADHPKAPRVARETNSGNQFTSHAIELIIPPELGDIQPSFLATQMLNRIDECGDEVAGIVLSELWQSCS